MNKSKRRGKGAKVDKNEFPNIVKRVIVAMTKDCEELTKRRIPSKNYDAFKTLCKKAAKDCSLKRLSKFYYETLNEGQG